MSGRKRQPAAKCSRARKTAVSDARRWDRASKSAKAFHGSGAPPGRQHQLELALLNLFVNARDALESDGAVGAIRRSIQISSARGRGTTVSLWPPVAESLVEVQPAVEPPATEPLTQPLKPASRPFAILVVDDDALVRTGTVAMLEDLGHLPQEAAAFLQELKAERAAPG